MNMNLEMDMEVEMEMELTPTIRSGWRGGRARDGSGDRVDP